MSGTQRLKYSREMRSKAISLFEQRLGSVAVSNMLGISEPTVRKWLRTFRAVGSEGLLLMGSRYRSYSWELKLAAVKAVEEGMPKSEVMAKFGIASLSPLQKWCKDFREGGPDALKPKRKGRPKDAGLKPPTREQELERRIRKLEAENAYLKKVAALKAERSRTATKRQS